MPKTRTITLAGSEFAVPLLPIRLNKVAYPICRKLHNGGFLDRVIEGRGQVDCSAEEMEDLADLCFTAVQAAEPRITREEFDGWPISPPELVDAYIIIRYQTGAWIAPDELETGDEEAPPTGEAQGAETLPT